MRKTCAAAAVLATLIIVAACSETSRDGGIPTAPRSSSVNPSGFTLGKCTTLSDLNALAALVFANGSPNVNSVLGKLKNLDKDVQRKDTASSHAHAQEIVGFVQKKAAQGTLVAPQAVIKAFISGVMCYGGLSADTFLILPSDQPLVVTTSSGNSGISLQGSTFTEPTILTITILDPNGPSPLHTKLDQYPTYISITTSSSLTKPAVVAICLSVSVPASIFNRLRLGHQATAGFEITPPADPSFLSCPSSLASASRMPGWLKSLASLVLPKPLFARWQDPLRSGGVGGSATEFSPFDAVDPLLGFTGGVGGSATEFQINPGTPKLLGPPSGASSSISSSTGPRLSGPGSSTPGGQSPNTPRSSTVSGGVCTSVDATVGTALDPLCRPVVTLSTHNGTLLQNVPVSWLVTAGGGTIAPDAIDTQTCGAIGASAATQTDVNGKAGICWTLGPAGGANKAAATPSPGGDVPAGVTFSPPILFFAATGIKITPTATAVGANVVFDGLPHPGSGTCSNGLTPALTYFSGFVPVNVGLDTVIVTCGAGSATYNTVTAKAAISITPATPLVNLVCPPVVSFTGAVQNPCTASATGAGGAPLGTVPVNYSVAPPNDVGSYLATATFIPSGNYGPAVATSNFQVTFSFSDGFETESGWTGTGFWNRSTLLNQSNQPINNAAFPAFVDAAVGDASGGKLPSPRTGSYAFWYGNPSQGNYLGTQAAGDLPGSGGTSTAPNSGYLASPVITLPLATGTTLALGFDTWWEIESVNPSTFDIMRVAVVDVATNTVTSLGVLNPPADPTSAHPTSTPLTSGGFNAPPAWTTISQDLSAFRGKTIRLLFTFETRDVLYNGFRGWLIDNISITTGSGPSFTRRPVGSRLGQSSQAVPVLSGSLYPEQPSRPRP